MAVFWVLPEPSVFGSLRQEAHPLGSSAQGFAIDFLIADALTADVRVAATVALQAQAPLRGRVC